VMADSQAGVGAVWSLARQAVAAGVRCAVWQREGEDAWLALGTAQSAVTAAELGDGPAWPAGVPRVWFGGAFAAASTAGPWREWPRYEAWVPELLLRCNGGGVLAAYGACDVWAARMAAWPLPQAIATAAVVTASLDATTLVARIGAAERVCSSGELTKVVVAGREDWGPVAEVDAPLLAASAPAGTTRFLLAVPGRGVFVGATPETLARVVGDRLETHALAGTLAAGAPLPPGDKLEREHQAVVAAICTALADHCEVVACARSPRRRRVGALDHLETVIAARLRAGLDVTNVVAALHPTPAVGGMPQQAALAWLARHEHLDRGWYAGPLGWTGPGGGEAVVALRSILVRDGTAHAFAGAGIVAGSQADAELAEIDAKLMPARRALAALGEFV